MITSNLISLLKRQLEHELHNSAIYRNISMYLNVQGFKNLSKYYAEWSLEENKHATLVQVFLESLNIFIDYNIHFDVVLGLESSLNKFAMLTLDTENLTTRMIQECLAESYLPENCAMSTVFLLGMIKEQIEETDKANNINDNMLNIGENRALLQIFDNGFEG